MSDDVQEQWRELEETYSQMADEELESLGQQAYELTDVAKQALLQQAKSRGLKIDLIEAPPPEQADDDEPTGDLNPADLPLVRCSNVWNANEARTTMAVLYNTGIPAYLGPDLVEKVEDFHGSYEKGVQIQVRDADLQRAASALSRVHSPNADETLDEQGDYQAKCPKCGSEEIVFLELDRVAAPAGDDPKFHWHCDACGNDWEDDGVEEK